MAQRNKKIVRKAGPAGTDRFYHKTYLHINQLKNNLKTASMNLQKKILCAATFFS
jgi:hypothetical protein